MADKAISIFYVQTAVGLSLPGGIRGDGAEQYRGRMVSGQRRDPILAPRMPDRTSSPGSTGRTNRRITEVVICSQWQDGSQLAYIKEAEWGTTPATPGDNEANRRKL